MSVCNICRSIPLEVLEKGTGLSDRSRGGPQLVAERIYSEERLRLWAWNDPATGVISQKRGEVIGYPYHQSLNSLRESAASCPVCALVCESAEISIAAYNERNDFFFRQVFEGVPFPSDAPLKVVKRHDGIPGFSVMFDDHAMHGHWVIADLAACVFSDSPLADKIRGRPSEKLTISTQSLAWARQCIDECRTHHATCVPRGEARLPKRVLDLGAESHASVIRLIDTEHAVAPYAALSYCWGGVTFINTKSTNIDEMRRGVDIGNLPATFKDVIHVTRELGLRYLWIDALCIIQDSKNDWAEQSAEMSEIYSDSLVTICAEYSSNAYHGCSYEVEADRMRRVSTTFDGASAHPVMVYRNDQAAGDFSSLDGSPLSKRCWALQEHLLSKRLLYFCQNELRYQCLESFQTYHGYREIGESSKTALLSTFLHSEGGQEAAAAAPHAAALRICTLSLQSYTHKMLTKPRDALPAFSGMARRMQPYMECSYVAGLWSDWLIHGLSFDVRQGEPLLRPGIYDRYVAPSWSWASHGHVCVWPQMGGNTIAEVVSWKTELATENAFGEVSSGSVTLRTALFPLTVRGLRARDASDDGVYYATLQPKSHPVAEMGSVSVIDLRVMRIAKPDADARGMQFWLLPLFWSDPLGSGQADVYCLIVARSDLDPGEMIRVGRDTVGVRKDKHLKTWLAEEPVSKVVLV